MSDGDPTPPLAEPPRKKTRLERELFNLPNMITYGRVVAIPAVLAFMAYDSEVNAFIAAMTVALSPRHLSASAFASSFGAATAPNALPIS